MIIYNIYVFVDICVMSKFKIQGEENTVWSWGRDNKMYQQQKNNHQWFSHPIQTSSNCPRWFFFKWIQMGPHSRSIDPAQAAPPFPGLISSVGCFESTIFAESGIFLWYLRLFSY